MALIGNTVTFEGKFYLEDVLTDPDEGSIHFITYNQPNVIIDNITLTSAHKISTGIYRYDYVIPKPSGDMIFEFKGTISGNPSLNRAIITREWK
jgi:hypothetical protein